MANAEKTAPEKVKTIEFSKEEAALTQTFDPLKKYVFELVEENPERELPVVMVQGQRSQIAPHKKFKPWQNLVLTSQIIWKGQRRMIRYYDGCDSIFVDEQPKEKETIEQFIKQSAKRIFVDGKFGVFGDDRLLLIYMTICSWNVESPFRTRTANGIFRAVNPDKAASVQASRIDKMEEALQLAKSATERKMMIHVSYLGIPTTDWDSGNELSPESIRAAYRKEAMENPENFIDTFGNKGLEIKYYIDEAIRSGTITNKHNPNKATWGSKNTVICDISGLKSHDAIAQKVYEFSQTEEGQEFLTQLKALNE